VLKRLDEVDWAGLEHAYGPATDVPDQVRALRSPDAKTRDDGLWRLFGNIFHQGSRYEAASHATPFLVEVLAAEDTVNRVGVLELLTSIAIGYDECWLPQPLSVDDLRAAGPDEAAAYDSVRAGVPLFRTLLADSDMALRTRAAYALAWFPEEAPSSLVALSPLTHTATSTGVLEATAWVAIGLLGGVVDQGALTDDRPLVRWGAAIGLAGTAGPSADDVVIEELLTWVAGRADNDARVPFFDGDLAGYAGLALGQVGDRHADRVFDALLRRIPVVSGPNALPVMGRALEMAFPSGAGIVGARPLDDRQRRLIAALLQSPETEVRGATLANFKLLLRDFGLPANRGELTSLMDQNGFGRQ